MCTIILKTRQLALKIIKTIIILFIKTKQISLMMTMLMIRNNKITIKIMLITRSNYCCRSSNHNNHLLNKTKKKRWNHPFTHDSIPLYVIASRIPIAVADKQ